MKNALKLALETLEGGAVLCEIAAASILRAALKQESITQPIKPLSVERIKEVLIPVFMRQEQASIHWPDIVEEVRAIETAQGILPQAE